MSRRLVNRARANDEPSPAQRSRNHNTEADQEPLSLPDYEQPTCALTMSAKRALGDLHRKNNTDKYKRHLDSSVKSLSNSIGDINERLRLRGEALEKARERRARAGEEDEGHEMKEQERTYKGMNTTVKSMTQKAEKALRDLIDFGDELAMKETILTDVSQNVAAVPAPRPARRQRRQASNEEQKEENGEEENEEEEEEEEEEVITSALDILNKQKENYATQRAAKSMRARYDTNDYKGFKSNLHFATVGTGRLPVPHARTWFPEENDAAQRGHNDEESDDEVVIESASLNTKCPLTFQDFKEPYISEKCSHVFEKSAILNYIDDQGVAVVDPTAPGRGQGAKQVKCPQLGCERMLQASDLRPDDLLLRQLEQAKRQAAREAEEEEDDEDAVAPRGTQKKPAEFEEDDSIDVEEDEEKGDGSGKISRVKREGQKSRGPSAAPRHQESSAMDEDED